MSQIPSIAKAWRFPPDSEAWKGAQSLELRDVKVSTPGNGEVLVKLHAASLNYSNNQYFAGGPFTTDSDGGGLIPVSDSAGEIVAVGEGVTGWKIGDRVHSVFSESWFTGPPKPEHIGTTLGSCVQGSLTQYRVFPANAILPIPDHLSYEEAATIPCAGVTAWNALFEKRTVSEGSTILVLSSGSISTFGAQLAKAAGAKVIATTSSEDKAERYQELGVDHVVNYRETPNWHEKVMELTGGKGVDQVVEIGGQGTLIKSLKSIKQEGTVHLIGFLAQGEVKDDLSELAQLMIMSQGTITSVIVGNKDMNQRLK